jgi:hypothetical protein
MEAAGSRYRDSQVPGSGGVLGIMLLLILDFLSQSLAMVGIFIGKIPTKNLQTEGSLIQVPTNSP